MNRAKAEAAIQGAFERHVDSLVQVYMQNAAGEPKRIDEFVGNFHRGLEAADAAEARLLAEADKIFPE